MDSVWLVAHVKKYLLTNMDVSIDIFNNLRYIYIYLFGITIWHLRDVE